ncbi:MAG: PD40 domain-containing protein [Ardenticatenales bacterium]|nr:PD40 domain-containing protein [Ardenticatenales bacterium]
MGEQRTGRSERRPSDDGIAWEIEGERSIPRWADGAEDGDDARRRWGPAGEAADIEHGSHGSGGGGGDDGGDADLRAHPDSVERLRRWATRTAGAALAVLVLFGLVRAYRGDRTHRLIQRDVQHVVQLEAEALADGDRELYMSLQDERRRLALRRPDVAARWLKSVGPYAGLYFTEDPPELEDVVVAAKDAAHSVQAVTATVRVQATDGARVGRFVQVQRFVRSDDARWLHALTADAPIGDPSDLERFVAERIHAAFPAADGPVLRPALEAADRAVIRYCAAHRRCGGRARFAFGTADASAVDVAQRVTAPSSPAGWMPADEAARQLLAFSLARAAAHRLDYAFSDANLEEPPQPDLFRQPANRSFSPALIEAWLIEDADAKATDALIADPTAARLGLTLWHLDARSVTADAVSPRERATAARSFAATLLRHDEAAFEQAMVAWTTDADWGGYDNSIPPPVEHGIGPEGLAFALDWPVRQAPFVAEPIVMRTLDANDGLLVSREGGVVSVGEAACGGMRHSASAWSPDGQALAVACLDFDVMVSKASAFLSVLRRRADDGVWHRIERPTTIQPNDGNRSLYVTWLDWSPDGRSIAWAGFSEGIDDALEMVEVGGVWAVDVAARPVMRTVVVHRPVTDAYVSHLESTASTIRGHRPMWAPDGARVAFRDSASRGFILRSLDGVEAHVVRGAAMAWSPDGTRIARIISRSEAARATNGDEASGEVSRENEVDDVPAPDDGPENLDPYDGVAKYIVSVLDADSLGEVATMPMDRLAEAMEPRDPVLGFTNVNEVMGVEWSDDGLWLAASFRTAARCGDASDCVVALAWQPESDELHVAMNAPQTVDGQFGAAWQAGWVPDTHRLALYVGADNDSSRMSPIVGETWPLAGQDVGRRGAWQVDGDATIAFILDADSGNVTSVPRSKSRTLATLLPDYSPDGRWHVRRDRMWRLIVEPVDGIGGFREDDPGSGWRFNRPFCSPYLAWSRGR